MNKKNKIILIIVIIISVGIYFFYNYKEKEEFCLEQISYQLSNIFDKESEMVYVIDGGYTNQKFKTHDEAMDYCMKTMEVPSYY